MDNKHIDTSIESGELATGHPNTAKDNLLNGCEVLDERRLPFEERRGLSPIEDQHNTNTWDPRVETNTGYRQYPIIADDFNRDEEIDDHYPKVKGY